MPTMKTARRLVDHLLPFLRILFFSMPFLITRWLDIYILAQELSEGMVVFLEENGVVMATAAAALGRGVALDLGPGKYRGVRMDPGAASDKDLGVALIHVVALIPGAALIPGVAFIPGAALIPGLVLTLRPAIAPPKMRHKIRVPLSDPRSTYTIHGSPSSSTSPSPAPKRKT